MPRLVATDSAAMLSGGVCLHRVLTVAGREVLCAQMGATANGSPTVRVGCRGWTHLGTTGPA